MTFIKFFKTFFPSSIVVWTIKGFSGGGDGDNDDDSGGDGDDDDDGGGDGDDDDDGGGDGNGGDGRDGEL